MHHGKRWIGLGVAVLLLMSLVLSACSAPGASTTKEGSDTIVIGGLFPLSPPGSVAVGEEMRNAAQMAVDDINAKGGVNGKKLVLKSEDTQGTPEKGQSAAEKLISQEGAVAVFGEEHSSAALAEGAAAHQHQVPNIVVDAWSDDITSKQLPEVFRIGPNNTIFTAAVIEFMKDNGFKKAALIGENTDWGLGTVKMLEPMLDGIGAEHQSFIVDRTTKDFVPYLIKVKAFQPDIILNFVTGSGAYLIVKQARDTGFTSKDTLMFLGGAEGGEKEFWSNVGDGGVNLVWQSAYHPKAKFSDQTHAFAAAYKAKYGRDMTYVALQAYDAVQVIADAIKRAGSLQGDALIKALEATSYTGVRGKIAFPSGQGAAFHQNQLEFLFLQFTAKDQSLGDAQIVYPKDVATAGLAR